MYKIKLFKFIYLTKKVRLLVNLERLLKSLYKNFPSKILENLEIKLFNKTNQEIIKIGDTISSMNRRYDLNGEI